MKTIREEDLILLSYNLSRNAPRVALGLPEIPPTMEQVGKVSSQIAHFAKQGVKVRLK